MAEDNRQISPKRQIRNLLMVLVSSVICAFLVSGLLLYYYSPSGRYIVKNALLAPELTTTLMYNDTNHKTGGSSRFVFDGIEFSFYDNQTKQQRNMQLTQEQYQKLYQLIASDKSLLNVPKEVISQFNKATNATLTIKVRTESHAAWQDETKIFQAMRFVNDGDYFNIELHEEKSANNLVYFYHPGIYKEILQSVIP